MLSKLERVDLREEWADEAKNFTPWLGSNEGLALLGESLGMELELVDTEVYVGNYRADVVAKDILSEQNVVIENQLSSTNHDHIGKLFTYAASFDAQTIVWIAQTIREEHRQAINWFNEITVKKVDFFGFEVELLQIGDSPLAANFKLVCKPNEWTRTLRAQRQDMTEGDTLKLEYWTAFIEYNQSNNVNIRTRKPSAQHWYNIALGRGGFYFTLTLRTNHKDIGCELTLNCDDAKEMFDFFETNRDPIEKQIGVKLEWKKLPEGKSSRIIARKNLDPTDRNQWVNIFPWYADIADKFKQAFLPQLKAYDDQ